MGATYRDKDQMLQLLAIAAPFIERSVRGAIEAPQKKEALDRERQKFDTDQLYKKKLIDQMGNKAGGIDTQKFIPVEFAVQTGGEEMRLLADEKGMVPADPWKTQVQALATQGRIRQGEERIEKDVKKERTSNIEQQYKSAVEEAQKNETFIANFGYDPTLKDIVAKKKSELPKLQARAAFLRSEAIRASEGQETSNLQQKDLPAVEDAITRTGATPQMLKEIWRKFSAAESNTPIEGFQPKRTPQESISFLEKSLQEDLGMTLDEAKKIHQYYVRTGQLAK